MPPFPNLISESLLVNETVNLLQLCGGRLPAVWVVDRVMKIRKPEPTIARLLAQDLIERDGRLALLGDDIALLGSEDDNIELCNADFVVFDLETTGAKAPPCRVTEIGAFRISNGRIAGEFHTLVNPEMPIPPFIEGLTGISNEMVRGAPVFGDIADDLLRFVGGSILVAHNSRFDMAFLNFEVGRIYEDYRLGNQSLCTVQLCRRLLPDVENHKLNTVARYYAIDLINHHRAKDDAYATAKIFLNLLTDLDARGIRDIAGVRRFSLTKNYAGRS